MKKTCGLMANVKKTHGGLFPRLSKIECQESPHANSKHKIKLHHLKLDHTVLPYSDPYVHLQYISGLTSNMSFNETTIKIRHLDGCDPSLRPSTVTLLLCSLLFEFALWPQSIKGESRFGIKIVTI